MASDLGKHPEFLKRLYQSVSDETIERAREFGRQEILAEVLKMAHLVFDYGYDAEPGACACCGAERPPDRGSSEPSLSSYPHLPSCLWLRAQAAKA